MLSLSIGAFLIYDNISINPCYSDDDTFGGRSHVIVLPNKSGFYRIVGEVETAEVDGTYSLRIATWVGSKPTYIKTSHNRGSNYRDFKMISKNHKISIDTTPRYFDSFWAIIIESDSENEIGGDYYFNLFRYSPIMYKIRHNMLAIISALIISVFFANFYVWVALKHVVLGNMIGIPALWVPIGVIAMLVWYSNAPIVDTDKEIRFDLPSGTSRANIMVPDNMPAYPMTEFDTLNVNGFDIRVDYGDMLYACVAVADKSGEEWKCLRNNTSDELSWRTNRGLFNLCHNEYVAPFNGMWSIAVWNEDGNAINDASYSYAAYETRINPKDYSEYVTGAIVATIVAFVGEVLTYWHSEFP